MGITDCHHRIDRQAIFPNRILTGRQLERGDDQGIVKSDLLPGLTVLIGAHHILQGIDPIGPRGHITNRKLSLVVRTGSTDKWDRRKGGILQIRMHTDRNTRHRLQILGVQQDSGHLHTVDGFAGREREGIILQYILLIIIGDRIGKVYRIGRILLQRIHQLDDRLPAVRPDNGLLHLGWSDDHVLGRLIDLDQLIKNNLHLLSLIVYLVRQRRTAYELRRGLIIRPSVRRGYIRARVQHGQQKYPYKEP